MNSPVELKQGTVHESVSKAGGSNLIMSCYIMHSYKLLRSPLMKDVKAVGNSKFALTMSDSAE